MGDQSKSFQECCLYFAANSLSRFIGNIANDAFRATGLQTSYAHLLLLIIEEPGLSQGEISHKMNLKPSTITRFIDKLITMGYVQRSQEGRTVYIHPTEEGIKMKPKLDQALADLFDKYCEVLGKETAVKLTADIHKANQALGENE
ncbi:MarR family winged helix-turn-helix transcriptional regulator [Flammeovirga sp. EKP202]|uniref:MarR family winged helix-turn-helix transcriptional regulator n=1 Tax=Flammeovirga sp. EKP202 TaxID=2770592 RepID=UPI00165F0022|nr:MarR family transcriptional regulator [Flammeovirga sp. EKP202]MBD0402758.1 MarR family transcriptional regulator [Flammeovirga sp. EKP202]